MAFVVVQHTVDNFDLVYLDHTDLQTLEAEASSENENEEEGSDGEDESCPTFGPSSDSNPNPFGRRIHGKAMQLIGLQQDACADYKGYSSRNPELLYICALTVSIMARPVVTIPPRLDFHVSPTLTSMNESLGVSRSVTMKSYRCSQYR